MHQQSINSWFCIQKQFLLEDIFILLEGILEIPQGSRTIVVICHGFTGHKDQLLYKNMRDTLIQQGLGVFRFNFSIKNLDNDVQQFHVDSELNELAAVTSYLQNHEYAQKCSLAAVGHSYGATILTLYASKSNAYSSISLLAVKTYLRTSEDDAWAQEAKQKGYFTHTTSSKKEWRVHKQFLEKNNAYHAVMQQALQNIKTPTLVRIGSEDNQHNHTDFEFICNTLRCKHACEAIANTDHAFRKPHNKQVHVAKKVAAWIAQV